MEAAAIIESFSMRGEYYEFIIAGKKYGTKRPEVGEMAKHLLNQPVVIDYAETISQNINQHTGQPYVNRYLNGVRPASGLNTTQVPSQTYSAQLPQPTTTFQPTPTFVQPQPQTSTNPPAQWQGEDRGTLAGRNNLIGHALPYLLAETNGDKAAINSLLIRCEQWVQSGGDFFPPVTQQLNSPYPPTPQLTPPDQYQPDPPQQYSHPGDQMAAEIQQQFPGTTFVQPHDGIPF